MIGIYKITSPTNKVYIGQSWRIKKRWQEYRNSYKINKARQPKIYNSLRKYGIESHTFEIIHELQPYEATQENLDKYERIYIKLYSSYGYELLNLDDGGKKNRKVFKQQPPDPSIPHPNSKAISQYTMDGVFIKQWSSITSASKELSIANSLITRCCKKQIKSAGNYIWRYEKDKSSIKPVTVKNRKKSILQIDPITREVIREWPTISSAEKEYNTTHIGEGCRCSRGRKVIAGYVWAYKLPV